VTQGKGSRLRPAGVSRAEWERRYALAFPKQRKPRTKRRGKKA
jgi:hypothetical protein